MVFSSVLFLFLFLPLVMLMYHIVPQRGKNITLLIASILFYIWGEPLFTLILLASITIDYFIAQKIDGSAASAKRCWLALSLTLNIGLLAYFKYANFFIENIQQFHAWLGWHTCSWRRVALPIGISFVTFQKISYMVDIYRGEHKPQRRWSDLCLYILFFPQIIAGPIIRYKEIAGQLRHRTPCHDDRLNGMFRFIIGLSKKVLIANVLAEQADAIFALPASELSSATAWMGMAAYTLQIYFDFSGYSDMALGLGKLFGFHLPENFNFPYISRSFTEFWKRWHISLGRWMMDYLYIPLGGNRRSRPRTYLNLAIVFLISGLWHGAAWTFVLWGAYHGIFLILDKLGLQKILQRIGKLPAALFTLLFIMVGWVIFRADSVPHAWAYIRQLFTFQQLSDPILFNLRFMVIFLLAALCALSGLIPGIEQRANRIFSATPRPAWKLTLFLTTALLLILNGCALFANGFNPFIYFRF